MKKVTFSITVVVLLAMIVGLIGYDRFSTSQNAKKYQLEEKTTTTTKEETTKTKTKKEKNSQRIRMELTEIVKGGLKIVCGEV